MARLLKQRAESVGLPPGALIHIGEYIRERTRIVLYNYNRDHLDEQEIDTVEACIPYKEQRGTITWISVEGMHEVDVLADLGRCFDLHPLVLEHILNTDQRPKLEVFDNTISTTLKMIRYDENVGEIDVEHVCMILGENYVLSIQEGKPGDVFDPVRQRLRARIGNIRELGPDYLLYALIDVVVDHYFLSLESVGERIESLDEQAANDPTPAVLAEIRALKREMIVLRRSVWPLREVVDQLERGDLRPVRKATRLYFRSVYNHVIQVMDAVDAYREILAVMIDIYLSGVNNRMTAVMNTLTIISTIFLPLTFIVGVYGMNFRHMPELTWHWGYPAIWGVMILLTIAMLIYFRRRRWL